jgi:hypothetical protein
VKAEAWLGIKKRSFEIEFEVNTGLPDLPVVVDLAGKLTRSD